MEGVNACRSPEEAPTGVSEHPGLVPPVTQHDSIEGQNVRRFLNGINVTLFSVIIKYGEITQLIHLDTNLLNVQFCEKVLGHVSKL